MWNYFFKLAKKTKQVKTKLMLEEDRHQPGIPKALSSYSWLILLLSFIVLLNYLLTINKILTTDNIFLK